VKYTVSLGHRNYFELFLAKVFHKIMNQESKKMISFNFFRVFLLTANVSAVQCSLIAISANLRAKDNLLHKHWRKDLSKVKETLSVKSQKKVKNSYFVRLMKRMFQINIFRNETNYKRSLFDMFWRNLVKEKLMISYKKCLISNLGNSLVT
jgi:hypothetical protein